MNTLSELLAIYPSHYALATDLGMRHDAVYRWFTRGRIPYEKWEAVIESAKGRGHTVTIAELHGMTMPRQKQGYPLGLKRVPR